MDQSTTLHRVRRYALEVAAMPFPTAVFEDADLMDNETWHALARWGRDNVPEHGRGVVVVQVWPSELRVTYVSFDRWNGYRSPTCNLPRPAEAWDYDETSSAVIVLHDDTEVLPQVICQVSTGPDMP